ncbi:tRNA (adenosine(37)-N6)-threonylcarbamoyltransferase complex ATPase subunit type 1 TsaE [Aquabacterium sp. A3]|uniref:tRNA (adenosine(37)-N6)-threonylcarbamoyltransferase complex ATPase subunit type 1 TsaE n=1 Tax=Aquabacterium sp. A3 TaxID=3132829 RepID=UPI003119FC0F
MHAQILASADLAPSLQADWPDEPACCDWATRLAAFVRPSLIAGGSLDIHLLGTLGAGKTTFTRHLLRALGVQGRIKSPSYAVVESHPSPEFDIHHFDFYRFNDPHEWEDAGFRDVFGATGLRLVEWPEKAQGLLPTPALRLHIEPVDEHRRTITLQSLTPEGAALLADMQRSAPATAPVTAQEHQT